MKTSKINPYVFVLISLIFMILPNTALLGVVVKNNKTAKISTTKKASKFTKLKQKIQRKIDRFKKKMDRFTDGDRRKKTILIIVIGAVLLFFALLFINAIFATIISTELLSLYITMAVLLGATGSVMLFSGISRL